MTNDHVLVVVLGGLDEADEAFLVPHTELSVEDWMRLRNVPALRSQKSIWEVLSWFTPADETGHVEYHSLPKERRGRFLKYAVNVDYSPPRVIEGPISHVFFI